MARTAYTAIRWLGMIVCAVGLFSTGCTHDQWATIMGDGFHDDMSKTGANLRPGEDDKPRHYDGVSEKSQEIERHLNVD
jgi:hypothetical protein